MRALSDHRDRPRVAVTGLGVKSPAGLDVTSFWETIRAGRATAAPIRRFDASALPVRFAGEVSDEFDPVAYFGPKEARRADRDLAPAPAVLLPSGDAVDRDRHAKAARVRDRAVELRRQRGERCLGHQRDRGVVGPALGFPAHEQCHPPAEVRRHSLGQWPVLESPANRPALVVGGDGRLTRLDHRADLAPVREAQRERPRLRVEVRDYLHQARVASRQEELMVVRIDHEERAVTARSDRVELE